MYLEPLKGQLIRWKRSPRSALKCMRLVDLILRGSQWIALLKPPEGGKTVFALPREVRGPWAQEASTPARKLIDGFDR